MRSSVLDIFFSKNEKLCPRYICPYRISKSLGNEAHGLELPQELEEVHSVLHLSMFNNCMSDDSLIMPFEDNGIKDSVSNEEIPVQILDHNVRKLRTTKVTSIKVLWKNKFVEEATWEDEKDMKKRYPHVFEFGETIDQVLL
ncbi:uncharacterized protein [Solanum lycopersicum]|uniref:uncharacterized protein n=1 Tax=Solanum lycopersicum TaxID=4081 RepID=UPI003747FFE0